MDSCNTTVTDRAKIGPPIKAVKPAMHKHEIKEAIVAIKAQVTALF